jgi:predicted outer membrane repeat protein
MRTAKLVLAVLGACFALPAAAATYVVNTTDIDLPDADTSLAGCDANPVLNGDQCTLRAAIMQANAGAGADTIVLPVGATITLTLGGLGGADSGDLDITQPVVITGAPLGYAQDESQWPLIVAANGDRVFDVTAPVAVELRGLRATGGAPAGASGSNGAGLRITAAGAQVVVDHVRLSGNEAVNGGGIANAGTLEILDSDIYRNRASGQGAAIHNSGNLTIRRSSLRSVRDVSGHAEAVYTNQGSTLVVENTLIDGAPDIVEATPTGGIFADRPAQLTLRNSTLSGFSEVALDVVADGATQVHAFNSILAGSDDTDCRVALVAGPPPDILFDYDLVENSECLGFDGVGNVHDADPMLEPLTSSQGSVVIARRVFFGSPAVDHAIPPDALGGDPARQCASTDQRGSMRPLDGDASGQARCDIGAHEASALTSSTYTVNAYAADLVDSNPGDNHCDADAMLPGDQCTLRAAVMEANAHDGPDRIEFAADAASDNTVTLTLGGAGGAAQGDLDILDQVVISGRIEAGRPLTTITTNLAQRLFDVALPPGYTLRLENLRLTGGSASGPGEGAGGALRVSSDSAVTVDTVEFAGNSAVAGGGAIAMLDGSLFLTRSDLHDNTAGSLGAALYTNVNAFVDRSSLWNNVNASASEREAIRVEGPAVFSLYNSTVSGNSGGIWANGPLQLDLRESTIDGNAQYGLRAVKVAAIPQVNLNGTILSGNGAQDCSLVGTSLNANHNLVQDGSCAVGGTNLGGDPLLAPALTQFDGKLARVRVPLAGSPVIDAVPAAALGCLSVDARGSVRPTDSDSNGIAKCEIGAIELFQAEADPKNFVVNVFDQDRDDVNPGDTRCDTSSDPGQQCTLRAAVMESNALPGANSIQVPQANATIVLTQAPVAGPASAAHGDLDLTDAVTITGVSGSPALRPLVQSSTGDRIFNIAAAGDDVVISGLRLSGGTTSGSGGAIRVVNANEVTIERVAMFGNSADLGGGALSVAGGTVTLDQSDLYDNVTTGEGAAIRNASELSISRSSVRGNGDAQPPGQREAIAGVGGGTTFVFNSTISGNNGDAIAISDGTLDVENSTLADNGERGIGFVKVTGRTLFLRNAILDGNESGGCTLSGAGAATISTDGYNLSQGYGCVLESGGSNRIAEPALLGALVVDPAKWSAYFLPQYGSAAIDHGHPLVGGLGCLAADQLDSARATDGDGDGNARCDIGAVETAVYSDVLFADGFEED